MKPQNYGILLAIIASWGIHLSLSAQTGVFVCPGDSALLTIDSTGGTLQWQISPDGIAWFNLPGGTTDSFKVAPDSGFFYRGEVHFNNCNPGYSDTLQIWIADSVQGTAGNDTLICLGDSAQLGGQPTAWGGAGGYQYHWSPGNWLDDSTSANPFAFPPDSTVFYLEVRDSLNCSLFLDTVRVHVLDPLNDSVVYNFSGMVDTFLVPRCIDSLYLELFGAEGNRGGGGDIGYGGLGGYSGGTLLNVAPGDTFYIYVGGQGGWNGGGPGGNGGPNASGNGGGGSDVRRGGSSLLNRIVVAGGGGGGAGGPQQSCAQGPGGSGGSGGAHTGGTGTTGAGCNPGGEGGFGGSSTNGGLGGLGNANCNIQAGTGTQGSFGVGGQGGDGTIGCFGYTGSGGGGGGGGWFGGGGGGGGAGGAAGAWSGGGGGGGSSYIGGMSYGFMYQGVNRGDGKIVIKW